VGDGVALSLLDAALCLIDLMFSFFEIGNDGVILVFEDSNTVDERDDSAPELTPFTFKVFHATLERCFGDHAEEEEL